MYDFLIETNLSNSAKRLKLKTTTFKNVLSLTKAYICLSCIDNPHHSVCIQEMATAQCLRFFSDVLPSNNFQE